MADDNAPDMPDPSGADAPDADAPGFDLGDTPQPARASAGGYRVLRLYAGLEDPEDLIADLEPGFERLNAA